MFFISFNVSNEFPIDMSVSPPFSLCPRSSLGVLLVHHLYIPNVVCFLGQSALLWSLLLLLPFSNLLPRLNSFPVLAVVLVTLSKLPLHLPRAIFLPNPEDGNYAFKALNEARDGRCSQ